MTIKVALEHRTTYNFDRLTKVYPHVLRLRPAPHSRTPIEAYSLKVEPGDHFLNWQQDAFSNYLARLVFPEPTTVLSFTVGLVADLTAINPFDFFIEEWAENVGFEYPEELRRDLEVYLRPVDDTGADPLVAKWVDDHRVSGKMRVIDYLVQLNLGGSGRRPLHGATRGGCAGTGVHPRQRRRFVPRLRMVAGRDSAAARSRGPFRLRLPRPVDVRHQIDRRPVRS